MATQLETAYANADPHGVLGAIHNEPVTIKEGQRLCVALFAERGAGVNTPESAHAKYGAICAPIGVRGAWQSSSIRTVAMFRPIRRANVLLKLGIEKQDAEAWRITNTPSEVAEHLGLTTKRDYICFTRLCQLRSTNKKVIGGKRTVELFRQETGLSLKDPSEYAELYRQYFEHCAKNYMIPLRRWAFGFAIESIPGMLQCDWTAFMRAKNQLSEKELPPGGIDREGEMHGLMAFGESAKAGKQS